MGKQGPCCHCGISTTPLWRNGPPDKPVLCNACGSRWRTKGTLVNYMPMHLTGCGGKSNSADLKFPRGKKGSHKSIEQRSHKRKEPCDGHGDFAYGFQKSDLNVFKSFEEDASTRSSTGSGISYSEGCIQHSGGMGENFSGFWILGDCRVPSKKRTSMYRHGPAQAKVTQMQSALYDFDSSVLDYPSEEDLLVEYKPSSMAAEIGLGGVFIRQPTLADKEQESEASSLKFESKNHSHFQALRPESPRAANSSVQIREESDKNKPTPNNADIGRIYSDKSCMPNKALLENFPYNKRDVLQSSQSPLVFLELKDIVNFDTFVGLLTDQEQLQLMKYVSSADFSRTPESLRRMFNSAQFESSLANIQLLLSEGMFDASDSGLNPRVLQHYQQLLTLTDLTGSGWMEQCSQIFNRNKRRGPVEFKAMQGKEFLREKISVPGAAEASALTAFGVLTDSTERSFGHANIGADMDYVGSMKNNISVQRKSSPISVFADVSFGKNCQAFEQRSKQRGSSLRDTPVSEKGGNSGSCISSNSFYCLSVEKDSPGQCGIIEALVDEGSEPDILLDLPSNMTFQQAELLQQPSWNKSFSTKGPGTDGDLKLDDSGTLVALNTWHAEDNLDWAGLLWNPASTGTGSISGNLLNSRKMFL